MPFKKTLIAAGALLTPLLTPLAAPAATFSQMFVFGDSLSDTGNLYAQTNALIPFVPSGIPASPPYAQRFSNDDLWVEYLADEFIPGPDALTVSNFAVGGATTSDLNIINNFDDVLPFPVAPDFDGLEEQVEDYLGLSPMIDPDALYTLWAGANDYLGGGITDPTIPVGNLAEAINAFVSAGVQNLLVLNLPDLGRVPANAGNPAQSAALSAIANQHNTLLAQTVQGIEEVTLFDVKSLFDQALAGGFGFTNTTSPCLQGFVAPIPGLAGVPCSNPDETLFWDDIHPTTRAHAEIAQAVFVKLHEKEPVASTPEPGSVLSLLALGAIAAVIELKRRQRPAQPVRIPVEPLG
ncbi:SGNH/GDSL hydrolase family protein [Sphaerothrix gracilis]|uniref:SGNH/GDSL hydrolase family protein n=1 Tax=Sphaerothrix gracilis TaxID=3151835 RepID=UPI0031FE3AA9